MFSLLRPFLFNLDPETAHDLAIKSLKFNILPSKLFSVMDEEMLSTKLFGKEISNPIGLAAGFDKSGEVYNEIFKLGFGFAEIGTITPRQQYGNEKPRVFRLKRDHALINRLGFNNDGSEVVKKRIENNAPNNLLGINIGPNKDTEDMLDDFIKCANIFFPLGDYITVNISSPNTPGLRDFHKEDVLRKLLSKINEIREKSNFNKFFLIKISPDLESTYISGIIKLILEFNIDGVILTNTTDKNRENLLDDKKKETGGLSGRPLKDLSTEFVRIFYKELKDKIPIIGVGGIDSGKAAFEKIAAGASAVQLYTGLIYKGPSIIKEIKKELIEILKQKNFKNINEAIGTSSK
tara:strand:+ start:132 stop:1181 length:1050 start_codon:yes stop_codon:yes gene_type:complete